MRLLLLRGFCHGDCKVYIYVLYEFIYYHQHCIIFATKSLSSKKMAGTVLLEPNACLVEVPHRLAFHVRVSFDLSCFEEMVIKIATLVVVPDEDDAHSDRNLHQGRAGYHSCRRCLPVCP